MQKGGGVDLKLRNLSVPTLWITPYGIEVQRYVGLNQPAEQQGCSKTAKIAVRQNC